MYISFIYMYTNYIFYLHIFVILCIYYFILLRCADQLWTSGSSIFLPRPLVQWGSHVYHCSRQTTSQRGSGRSHMPLLQGKIHWQKENGLSRAHIYFQLPSKFQNTCPGPTPLQAGEKSQLIEAKCLPLKQREGPGEARALVLWSSVEAGLLPEAANTAAAGSVSALLLQVLNYSGSTGACRGGGRDHGSQVQLQSSRVGPVGLVGGMCPQPRIPNCPLLLCLVYWGAAFSQVGWGALEATAC